MALYIFCGKGGVGKTTLAVEWANYLNETESTVIVGLDLQQNHRDLIRMRGYDVPYEVVDNSITEFVNMVIESTVLKNFKMYAEFIAPDFISVCSMGQLYDTVKDRYENIVIDFPPNHAGLNMIGLPELMANMSVKVVLLKNRVRKMVTGKDELWDKALEVQRIYNQFNRAILDAKWCPVGIPAPLSVIEMKKVCELIKSKGGKVHKALINMVSPIPEADCVFCVARYYSDNYYLARYADYFEAEKIGWLQIPFAADELDILDSLQDLG